VGDWQAQPASNVCEDNEDLDVDVGYSTPVGAGDEGLQSDGGVDGKLPRR
jgi:hypothetical protein